MDKLDKFLELHNLLRLYHKGIRNPNRSIISTKIESVIENLPKKRSLQANSCTGKFHQILKKILEPIIPYFYQEIEEEKKLPNSFYETNINLILKPKTPRRKPTKTTD